MPSFPYKSAVRAMVAYRINTLTIWIGSTSPMSRQSGASAEW